MINLGYCVVFNHGEQGFDIPVVVVTSSDLERAISLVEQLSGYPSNHSRYNFEIHDLTKSHHEACLLGLDKFKDLKQFSPESMDAIKSGTPVDFTVQVFPSLGTRHWINRRWDLLTRVLSLSLHEAAERYKRKRQIMKIG